MTETLGERQRLRVAPFPHASAAGYERGCRSRGGCRYDESSEFLTCIEARIARLRNYALAGLAADQPIPRSVEGFGRGLDGDPAQVHGTVWGYRRGCRRREDCPNSSRGRISCVDMKRWYQRSYAQRRLLGSGAPIEHGTRTGYDLGCRGDNECPGGPNGLTCSSARSSHRRGVARQRGVEPQAVDGADALRHIAMLRRNGYSVRAIASLAGLGPSTLSAVVRRHRDSPESDVRMSPATRAAILAIRLP